MSHYIDAHCHIDRLKDIDSALSNCASASVGTVIANGLSLGTNKMVLELAKKHSIVKPALGLYPLEPCVLDGTYLETLEHIKSNKDSIIAIGEVGLDGNEDMTVQQEAFAEVIELAKELDKPLIIHSRKAEAEAMDILESMDAKKVLLHCFCGKKKLISKALDLGYYFSVPTNVVRATNFQMLANLVDLNHIFCETDAPYLSPFKDKSNEPSFVVEGYKKIASLKGITVEDLQNIIYMNYQKLF